MYKLPISDLLYTIISQVVLKKSSKLPKMFGEWKKVFKYIPMIEY